MQSLLEISKIRLHDYYSGQGVPQYYCIWKERELVIICSGVDLSVTKGMDVPGHSVGSL
jgi:hypothetical protein